MTLNMGMSKSGAETAEELKLSSLKHALHPSVLEELKQPHASPSLRFRRAHQGKCLHSRT
jgi:hypothetical protein